MRGGQLINLPSKRPEVAAHHPILYLTGDERGVIVVDAREGPHTSLGKPHPREHGCKLRR